MDITIHINTKKADKDYQSAINEYCKRTSPFCKLSVTYHKKADSILQLLNNTQKKNNTHIICIVPGKTSISSLELADGIKNLNLHGISSIDCIIADSSFECFIDFNNFNRSILEINNYDMPSLLNISSFEFDNCLSAVVTCEQIYRAYTILNNITYHK